MPLIIAVIVVAVDDAHRVVQLQAVLEAKAASGIEESTQSSSIRTRTPVGIFTVSPGFRLQGTGI